MGLTSDQWGELDEDVTATGHCFGAIRDLWVGGQVTQMNRLCSFDYGFGYDVFVINVIGAIIVSMGGIFLMVDFLLSSGRWDG